MAVLGKKNITQYIYILKGKIRLRGFVIVRFRGLLSRASTEPLGRSGIIHMQPRVTTHISSFSPKSSQLERRVHVSQSQHGRAT